VPDPAETRKTLTGKKENGMSDLDKNEKRLITCQINHYETATPASEFRARGKRIGFNPHPPLHSQHARVYTEFFQEHTFFFLSSSSTPRRISNFVVRDFILDFQRDLSRFLLQISDQSRDFMLDFPRDFF